VGKVATKPKGYGNKPEVFVVGVGFQGSLRPVVVQNTLEDRGLKFAAQIEGALCEKFRILEATA
jgi:hypothetical protein